MTKHVSLVFTLALCWPPLCATAQSETTRTADSDKVHSHARQAALFAWEVMDVVEKHHIEPLSRQDMMRFGLTMLYRRADKQPPTDLSSKVQPIKTKEQWANLVQSYAELPELASLKPEMFKLALLSQLVPTTGQSVYMSADDYKIQKQLQANRYVGIGIMLRKDEKSKSAQIVAAFRGGTARKAGIRKDDLILTVDGKDTTKLSLEEVVQALRGPEGSTVEVTVRAPDGKETRKCTIERAVVPIPSVAGYRRMADDSWDYRLPGEDMVAYVRMESIKGSSFQELRQLEPVLKSKGFRGMVLDLRGTGGTEYDHAALVADAFLDGGAIWHVRSKDGRKKLVEADRDCLFRDWPIVVLISKRTYYPAPVLLASALQERGRATMIGEPTLGMYYIHSDVEMADGKGILRIPTAIVEFSGRTKRTGVQPDISVPLTQEQQAELDRWLLAKNTAEPEEAMQVTPPDDPQLQRAVQWFREREPKTTRK